MNITKLFKKREQPAERWQDSPNWWKHPLLQGEENDYGDYDYFITDVPENRDDLYLTKYACTCDSCKKERHLYREYEYFFRTLDGYDSMSETTCWQCELKHRVTRATDNVKFYFKTFVAWRAYNKFHKIKAVCDMNTDWQDVEYPFIMGGVKLTDKYDLCDYLYRSTSGYTYKKRREKFKKVIDMWTNKECRKMLLNAAKDKLKRIKEQGGK